MTLWPNGRWSFAWQQLSAGYLMVYFPLMLVFIWPWLMGQTHSIHHGGLVLLTTFLALGLMMIHSWIGLRDIIIDYCPARHLSLVMRGFSLAMLIISLNLIILGMLFVLRAGL